MVQYAIIQHFDRKLRKSENFYLATIFKVKHRMSLFISIFFPQNDWCAHEYDPGPNRLLEK